ncbi:MAG TPA: subclass B3 metallo-beta-lactamase [Vicinamibacteria bacterium]
MRLRPLAALSMYLCVSAAPWASAQAPDTAGWNKPVEPFRIVGPVHYVGTNELAAYLIATPQGHVLIDGGLPESAPLIEKSIRALGFDPAAIEVLLTTQAHFDHVGSLAALQKTSGGRVAVMDGDVSIVESGGRTDYLFGEGAARAGLRYRFDPVKVDRTLHDHDTVTLGGLTLTARKTPGHTPGSTTWLTTVPDAGKPRLVVFAASTGINPGTRLADRPSYPGIAGDFARAFEVLESLKPDVFLGAHTSFFHMEEKRAKLGQGGENPFVDPEAFKSHVSARKRAFQQQLADERAAASRP